MTDSNDPLAVTEREDGLVTIKKTQVHLHGFEMPFSTLQVLSWVIALFILACFIIDLICMLMHYSSDLGSTLVAVSLGVFYFPAFLIMVI